MTQPFPFEHPPWHFDMIPNVERDLPDGPYSDAVRARNEEIGDAAAEEARKDFAGLMHELGTKYPRLLSSSLEHELKDLKRQASTLKRLRSGSALDVLGESSIFGRSLAAEMPEGTGEAEGSFITALREAMEEEGKEAKQEAIAKREIGSNNDEQGGPGIFVRGTMAPSLLDSIERWAEEESTGSHEKPILVRHQAGLSDSQVPYTLHLPEGFFEEVPPGSPTTGLRIYSGSAEDSGRRLVGSGRLFAVSGQNDREVGSIECADGRSWKNPNTDILGRPLPPTADPELVDHIAE